MRKVSATILYREYGSIYELISVQVRTSKGVYIEIIPFRPSYDRNRDFTTIASMMSYVIKWLKNNDMYIGYTEDTEGSRLYDATYIDTEFPFEFQNYILKAFEINP